MSKVTYFGYFRENLGKFIHRVTISQKTYGWKVPSFIDQSAQICARSC